MVRPLRADRKRTWPEHLVGPQCGKQMNVHLNKETNKLMLEDTTMQTILLVGEYEWILLNWFNKFPSPSIFHDNQISTRTKRGDFITKSIYSPAHHESGSSFIRKLLKRFHWHDWKFVCITWHIFTHLGKYTRSKIRIFCQIVMGLCNKPKTAASSVSPHFESLMSVNVFLQCISCY